MIIKNASFIFDFLTNKMSISITFEKISVPSGQTVLEEIVCDQNWTVTIQKDFRL